MRRCPPRLLIVKKGRGVVLTLATGAALTVAAMANHTAWEGVWSATVHELGIWMILAAPVAAAGAGWIASGNRRAGLDDLHAAATRSLVQLRARLAAETMFWVTVGYLIALAICGVSTARTATRWNVPGLLIVTQLAFLLLFVVLGLLAGRFLYPWLTIPLLGAGSYVVLAFVLVSGGPTLEWLSPLDNRTSIVMTVDGLVLGLRALWLLSLSAVLIALWSRKKASALVALWIAGLALSPLLLIGSADRSLNPAAARLSCKVDHRERVGACYPEAKEFNNDAVIESLSRLETLVPALLPGMTYFVSDEAVGYSADYDEAFDRRLTELTRADVTIYLSSTVFDTSAYAQIDPTQFIVSMTLTLVPPSSISAGADDQPVSEPPEATPSDYLEHWTLSHLGLDLDETGVYYLPRVSERDLDYSRNRPRIEWFEGLDASSRNSWMHDHRHEIATGTISWTDFG